MTTGDPRRHDREDSVPFTRRFTLAAAAFCALAAAAPATAQTYPSRPIHIVIAFPAGGPTDIVGRMLAEKLTPVLGQSIIIENKGGANGTLGADYVAKAEPDGHTLFLTTVGAVTVSPHMRSDLPYNALRDFAPVVHVVRNTTILVTNPKLGVKTAKDFVAMAKAKPDQMTYASTGIGGTPHLAMELFSQSAEMKLTHVPYRGAAPAVTDMLSGQVNILGADVPVLIQHIKGGALIPIGAASDRRSAALPDVPTLAEQGYPNTVSGNWYGLLAPAKTPPAVIAKLNAAFNDALKDPGIRQKLLDLGAEPVGGTPEDFAKFFKSEYDRWGEVVRSRNIKE
jgi:tripartite-type tricarboxylate transporter receptor subunit TctC